MNDRQSLRIPQRLERAQTRMQTEEAIEIHGRINVSVLRFRNGDVGSQVVVVVLTKRNDHVQTIDCTTLKDRNESLSPAVRTCGGDVSEDSTLQECGG